MRRKTYYSIVVDNDTSKRLEVIPSRKQSDVAVVLKQFKNVETVTRDFSKTYKAAIQKALPNAKQIVDRFHILKNLTDDVIEYLKRKVKNNIKIVDFSVVPVQKKEYLNKREQQKINTGLRKWEIIKEVQRLKAEGKNNSEIARQLQLGRPTVIKYLKITEPPIDSRPCLLDPFIPKIKELILAGYSYTVIFEQIKKEGYQGQISLYKSKMKGIRHEVAHNIRYLTRSDIKKLLYHPIESIKEKQKQEDIKYYLEKHKDIKKVLELVTDFKEIILGSKVEKLTEWLKKAAEYNIPEVNSFLKLIQSDKEAVENAIKYKYSNGLTEGHNNKINKKADVWSM